MFIASLPSENQKKHQEFSLLSAVYPIYNWMWYMIIKDKQTRKRQFLSKWRRQKYKNEKKVSKWSFTQSTFALGTTAFFIKLIHSGLSKNFTNSSTVKWCMQLLLKNTDIYQLLHILPNNHFIFCLFSFFLWHLCKGFARCWASVNEKIRLNSSYKNR